MCIRFYKEKMANQAIKKMTQQIDEMSRIDGKFKS